jgi:hypothetical protein
MLLLAYEGDNDDWVDYSAAICRDVEDVIRDGETCYVPCSDMGHMVAVSFDPHVITNVNLVQIRIDDEGITHMRTIRIPQTLRDEFPALTFISAHVTRYIDAGEVFWLNRALERAERRRMAQAGFAMGLHARLGERSEVGWLDGELLRMILDFFMQ